MIAVDVRERSEVAVARWRCRDAAGAAGLGEEDAGRAALVATEAGTNLLRHAGGGRILVGRSASGAGGIDIVALDNGPGMANLAACLTDGFSTAGGTGAGLGVMRRQADRFDIWSQPGQGAAIVASILPRPRAAPAATGALRVEGLSVPRQGESACGDAWAARIIDGRPVLMVCDGLGHGINAARAAEHATAAFDALTPDSPEAWMAALSAALAGTRGAAVALVEFHPDSGAIRFSGVGNIAGYVRSSSGEQRMVSFEGVVGRPGYRLKPMEYRFEDEMLAVFSSDGLATRWRLADYRGLAQRDPLTIAAVLYRDFRRERDDCTVVVARWEVN